MKHRSKTAPFLLPVALVSSTLLAACASLGTPEDQAEGSALWAEIDGHESWGHFAGHEGVEQSDSVHGDYVVTHINGVAASNEADPPHGSVLVKRGYESSDGTGLNAVTVMKRIEGYDPENGDWFWARYEPDGEMTHSGKVAMCIDCHFDASDDDFVFLND